MTNQEKFHVSMETVTFVKYQRIKYFRFTLSCPPLLTKPNTILNVILPLFDGIFRQLLLNDD